MFNVVDELRSSPTTRAIASLLLGYPSLMKNDCELFAVRAAESRTESLIAYLTSVGDAAKNAFHSNPENTVFDAKRLIGRKMDDPEVKRDQKHWYPAFN